MCHSWGATARAHVQVNDVPDLENGWTDCAQTWYIDGDQLVGGRAQVNWRYPGAISHVQGSLSRSLRWSPKRRYTGDLPREKDREEG